MTFEEVVALVPEGYIWLMRSDRDGGFANVIKDDGKGFITKDAERYPTWASTPLLALEAAAKRAQVKDSPGVSRRYT